MKNVKDVKVFVDWIISCVILHNLLAKICDQWLELYDDNDPAKIQAIPEVHENGAAENIREKVREITLDWYNNL